MKSLAAAFVVALMFSTQLSAQERDRALERINLALQQPLQQPLPVLGGADVQPPPAARRLGPFKLETPRLRGEIIRLSLPVGEYVSRGARGIAAAHRRRQERAARRMVEAELKALAERTPKNP